MRNTLKSTIIKEGGFSIFVTQKYNTMKKITLNILLGVLISINLFAQIPNASFENWTGSSLNDWTDATSLGLVVKSSNAHAGSSAARINVMSLFVGTQAGILMPTPNGSFTVTANPVALHGWYIFNSAGGDSMAVVTVAMDETGYVGAAALFHTNTSTSVYKEFIIDYPYFPSTFTADSIGIVCSIVTSTGAYSGQNVASYVILDDLSFGLSSINDNKIIDFSLENAYPNPSTKGATNIIYNLPSHSETKLILCNITGLKVKELLNEPSQAAGRYKVIADTGDLPNGIYFYTLTVNGTSQTKKLTVVN
jgi:hypothetical protein